MTTLMYHNWINHGIEPSKIYNMKKGELEMIKAFYIIDMERRHSR